MAIASHFIKRAVFVFAGFLFAVFAINIIFFASGSRMGVFHRWAGDQYFGKITAIQERYFTIADQEGRENTILVKNETRIMQGRLAVAKDYLRAGEYVMVVGSANEEKQIEARVIRIFNGRQDKIWNMR